MLTYLLIIITLYLAGNAYIFIRAKQALKVKSHRSKNIPDRFILDMCFILFRHNVGSQP